MFCIVAAVVLSILGIFSAANRRLAKEALDCVFRRITFRPCNTGFDEKMKAKILGKMINRSEGTARFLSKNFEILAWIFFVLMLVSSVFMVRSLYLFYTTGSCNGANDAGFCVFDPTGEHNETSSTAEGACPVPANITDEGGGLTLNGVDINLWPVKNTESEDQFIFIGCYSCDYTRKVYPDVRRLVDEFQPEFFFGEYPTKLKTDYLSRIGYCVYNQDQEKYWQMNDAFFAQDIALLEDVSATHAILTNLGMDADEIEACAAEPETEEAVQNLFEEIRNTNFYGTPTIFINGEPLVGPKPFRVYAIQLEGLFYWLK